MGFSSLEFPGEKWGLIHIVCNDLYDPEIVSLLWPLSILAATVKAGGELMNEYPLT